MVFLNSQFYYFFSAERNQNNNSKPNKSIPNDTNTENGKKSTWISDIFQGIFTSETRCLNCETVTSKDEDFFDLSIDVEQNTSITSCLRNFSNTETSFLMFQTFFREIINLFED